MGRVTVEKSFELHMGRDGVSTICLGVLHGLCLICIGIG